MSSIIHARLDPKTHALLRRLRRQLGRSDSEIVRAGLRSLSQLAPGAERKIIGLGRFASGRSDLGSNKTHLGGFGK
jgi:hypothetical protein